MKHPVRDPMEDLAHVLICWKDSMLANFEARFTILSGVSGLFFLGSAVLMTRTSVLDQLLPSTLAAIISPLATAIFVVLGLVRIQRAIRKPIAFKPDAEGIYSETSLGQRYLRWEDIKSYDRLDYSLLCLGDTLTIYAKKGAGIALPLNQLDRRAHEILAVIHYFRKDLRPTPLED